MQSKKMIIMANNIIEYINENIEKINTFHQDGVKWIDFYKKTLGDTDSKKESDFLNAIEIIKKTPKLCREDVRKYWAEDKYTGFIATILWGHIRPVHLRTIMTTKKESIVSQLNKMFDGFKKEGQSLIFEKMLKGGSYHIDGISISFFTKIFYFTSNIHGKKNLLILDAKMWDAYNAFLIAKNNQPIEFRKCNYFDYYQYCDIMHSFSSIKNPGQLEAYLFTHNKEVKTFINTKHINTFSQKNKKKEHKSSNLKNYQNNEWAPYEPFSTLRGSTGGMEFVEPGYCLPIINQMGEIEQYRIFVAKHLRGKYEGQLFCKLEKEWGKEVGNIEDNPNAFKILNHFTDEHSINEHIVEEKDGKWHRGTGVKYAYRYATFDKTIDITDAIGFMTDIKKYVQSELNK